MPPRAATPAHNMFEDADKDSDGLSARSFAELERMQREREERSQAEACEKYCKVRSVGRAHKKGMVFERLSWCLWNFFGIPCLPSR